MNSKVFCIIPAWNESATIASVVQGVKEIIDTVIVIDDASLDDTANIAKANGAIVLRHLINRDQGAALQTGNDYAIANGADIIVHFDADGQFLAEDIISIIDPLQKKECDVVFGSRFLGKESNIPPFKKNVIMPLARLVNRIFFGIRLSDPQSGFRAMTVEAAKKFRIEQDGKAHCSEILYKVHSLNLRIKEVPITVRYYEFGQRFSGGIRIVKDLIMGKLID